MNYKDGYCDGYESGAFCRISLYKAGMDENKKREWVDLTVDEATIIWERVDERDGWELIMQVQRALKEKNGG